MMGKQQEDVEGDCTTLAQVGIVLKLVFEYKLAFCYTM